MNPVKESLSYCSRTPQVAFYFRRLLRGGGAERVAVNLIQEMVRQGISVDLILNQVEGSFLDLVPDAVRVVDLQASRTVAGLPKLISYLRNSRPRNLITGLHYNSEVALLANIFSGELTRVLVIEHNMLSINSQGCRSTDRWATSLAHWLYPRADRVIAVSHGVAADLSEVTQLPINNIEVIYNPIITPELTRQAAAPVDHPWFQPGQPPIIVGIGRLVDQKDFSTLLRAFSVLRQQRECHLVLLGEGRLYDTLSNLAVALQIQDQVDFLGFTENPYRYLAKASLFVLSSAWEGFANVVAEAIALQVPVVSTDCPSGPREILANGKYGTLVPVADSAAMAKAMLSVLDSPSKIVPAEWLSQFSSEAITNRYIQLLKL